jgi:hypothetical protein
MTQFYKKDGNASSNRHTLKAGSSKINMTNYFGSSRGGLTIRSGNMTTRFNSRGQSIGTSLKTGRTTTYFGKNGTVVSQMPSFR